MHVLLMNSYALLVCIVVSLQVANPSQVKNQALIAAIKRSDIRVVKRLPASGANPNAHELRSWKYVDGQHIRPPHSAAEQNSGQVRVHVFITPQRSEDNAASIGAVAGGRVIWTDNCSHGRDSAVAATQTVYYSNGRNEVVARRFDGRVLWRKMGFGSCMLDCAGTGVVFITDEGPNWGVAITKPQSWVGDDGVFGGNGLTALDSRTGQQLWHRNPVSVGEPLWTNGRVYVDVRCDVSKRAIQRVIRSRAALPVWLELRRVRDQRVIWKQRLRGMPPGIAAVTPADRNSVRFAFTDRRHYRINAFRFLPHLSPFSITLPVDENSIRDGGLQSSVRDIHVK